ncbi:hypothetical protein EDB89DRAFT_1911831 [Lactarius sanguifluus]|nr:hypothetical protein EDB89DRAFT_1911831 [Lactarius sanguifluus]
MSRLSSTISPRMYKHHSSARYASRVFLPVGTPHLRILPRAVFNIWNPVHEPNRRLRDEWIAVWVGFLVWGIRLTRPYEIPPAAMLPSCPWVPGEPSYWLDQWMGQVALHLAVQIVLMMRCVAWLVNQSGGYGLEGIIHGFCEARCV